MDNCVTVTKRLLGSLKIPCTRGFLEDRILSHPGFPSLLSISDTLDRYNLSQLPVKISKEKLDQVSLPCIVQVSGPGMGLFYTLARLSDNEVVYFDENGNKTSTGREDFLRMWTGVALLVEKNEDSAEPGIEERLKEKRIKTLLIGILSLFTLIGLGTGLLSFGTGESVGVREITITTGYLLLKLAGLGISGLILWREIDRDNPLVQKLCSGGGKTDCNSVLDTSDLKFSDGAISPGSLAFAYFFAGFLMLVTHSSFSNLLSTLGWLSLATLPIVGISLYYQAFKIRKWCRLCLILLGVLLLEMALAWMGQFYRDPIGFGNFSVFAVLFIGAVLVWMYLKPILDAKDDLYYYKRNLKKLKSNPAIFESLLSRSGKISNPTEGLGIQIKNKSPRYHVIKVCNPYCGPCAKAHPELDKLVHEGSIDLQIIFYPNAGMEDPRTKTISHFLVIDSKGDKKVTQEALDKWYKAEKKDYGIFAKQYSMNGELEQQGEKLRAMKEWCEKEGITHTPTIFINGYKLPDEYSIADLREINI